MKGEFAGRGHGHRRAAGHIGTMTEAPPFDCDVVIAGGGLNGTALALALASGGHEVVLVDPLAAETRADPGFDGRAYALALASVRLLAALGLWGRVADRAQPILGIRTADGRPGEAPSPLFLGFDDGEIDDGPMGQMVEDRVLRPALLAAVAEAPRIVHRAGVAVTGHAPGPGGVTLALSDGGALRAQLLVAADGRDSALARAAGIGRVGHGYGQTALVAAVSHERPHGGIAHQLFLPAGPLAILPLPGNRASIVWSERDAIARALAAADDATFLAALRPRFGGFLGEIALAGGRFAYPLRLSLAERMVAPRLALAGDAAHGVHPVAGQGLNLGLRDVAALAEVLTEARRRGEDIGAPDVLAGYERWRRADNVAMGLGMDAVTRLFSNDNPLARLGRDLGLGAVARLPGLRRRIIAEAAGLTGELPRLMAGRPL